MPILNKRWPMTKSFPAERRSSREPKEPAEVLMVEDSATDAELARRAFQRAGVANPLTVLSSSEQALAYLLGTGAYAKRGPVRPLLILLDLQLPGMSGLDFLRQIKTNERTMGIPVVSLSMTKSAPTIVMGLRLGVDGHSIKPFDFAALVRITRKLKLPLTMILPEAPPTRIASASD